MRNVGETNKESLSAPVKDMEMLYSKLVAFYDPLPPKWTDLWLKQSKSESQKLEVVVGAVLTQNTSWNNVEQAINNLKEKKILRSPLDIIKTSKDDLIELIRPAGFYNAKSEYLRNACAYISENSSPSRKGLLSVKGIGNETADSILLYAYGEPVPVIDAFTRRVFSRVSANKKFETVPYWRVREITNWQKWSAEKHALFHACIVLHAQEICLKTTPKCPDCPIGMVCEGKNKEIM